MAAACTGSLAAALLLVQPTQVNLLGYTGSNAFLRALNALAKATTMRDALYTRQDYSIVDVERAHMHDLFVQYKKLRDPQKIKDKEGELTVQHDEDPTEVLMLADVLSLQATSGLQVQPELSRAQRSADHRECS